MLPQGFARRRKQESSSLPRKKQNKPASRIFLRVPHRAPRFRRRATSASEPLAGTSEPRVAPESPKRQNGQRKPTLKPLRRESKPQKKRNPRCRRYSRAFKFKTLPSRALPWRQKPCPSSRPKRRRKNLVQPDASDFRCWH